MFYNFHLTPRSCEIWLRLILTPREALISAGLIVDGKIYGPEIKLTPEA